MVLGPLIVTPSHELALRFPMLRLNRQDISRDVFAESERERVMSICISIYQYKYIYLLHLLFITKEVPGSHRAFVGELRAKFQPDLHRSHPRR